MYVYQVPVTLVILYFTFASSCHLFLSPFNPFRTKTPNIYSQEEINLYCIIKLAT